jgi:ornithine cyclodeaminase
MIILSAAEVRQALPMGEVIQAMKAAYAALSNGQAELPLRTQLPVPTHEAVTLFMPVFLNDAHGEALAVKVVSLFPHNISNGLPLIHAVVLVLEANTGKPFALLEGSTLTALRTGAASGAATDLLARPDSQVVAIFGAGVQGRTQLEAVCTVRPIKTGWIFDSELERAEGLVREMTGKDPIPPDLRIAESPAQAVADADVICTATTSTTPVFSDKDLKPGVHINAVGAYTPHMQEIPPETVMRALLMVDSRSACLSEAGDLIQPIQKGIFTESHIHAELGEIVSEKQPGRTSKAQITLFKSVGVAVQDAAAARLALHNAQKLGLGQTIPW